MAKNPVQELFQTSWFIQTEALNRLGQRGNTTRQNLEHDFRSFYKDCLSKLNEVYSSISNQPTAPNRNTQLSIIQNIKSAACNNPSFLVDSTKVIHLVSDNFLHFQPPGKKTRLSEDLASEQTLVRFGYRGESEDDASDDDSDLTILKQVKELPVSEERVTINFKPFKKDSVPYDENKLKEKDNLPTPKFLEEKGNTKKISNCNGKRSSAKFSGGNLAGPGKENWPSVPLVKYPSFKPEDEPFSLGKQNRASNNSKPGETLPNNATRNPTRKSLIPIFEEFNLDDRRDIFSLSDLTKINGAENVDLDNFSASLEATNERKSKEGKRQIKRKSGTLARTEEDPLPLATVIHNYNQQKSGEPAAKVANNQLKGESLTHPSYFVSAVPLQNEISSTPNFHHPTQTQLGPYAQRMNLDVIFSEDEDQEKSKGQPLAYEAQNPYAFHQREVEYQDLLEMLDDNEQYDLSDYSSNESSNNGSYRFSHREESIAPFPLDQEILAECGDEMAPIPMNTACFNDPFQSNSAQLLENLNTYTGSMNHEWASYLHQHFPESSQAFPAVDPTKLHGICNSPKKKRKIQRLYCNHKKVPLWASSLEEVQKISRIQKQDTKDGDIFGKFEIENLNLAEIFGKASKKYNQRR